ncbi:MAG: signal peptidase I [Gammaproteobacteria bacterium]|nr:signal peptidase I [Gammaproteobacteria bacterium]
MHFDFEFLLVSAVVVSGIVWLIDSLLFAGKRKQVSSGQSVHEPILVEYAKSFFPVLLAVMILRSFLYEPFRIPSGSMMPTLLVGDFILVNKYEYGVRLPVIHTRLTEGSKVERGDVAVFRFPENESLDFIKRVVGLPGDHVSYYNRRLMINEKPVPVEFKETYPGQGTSTDNMKGGEVFIEQLGDIKHMMMTDANVKFSANGELIVPEGHYFVMGDNRDHSNDSRFWGFVPEENLVGKAVTVWMHWDWRSAGSGLDLSRIGTIL